VKILISRGDVLGDVVVTTPMIQALKARFPDCEIHYLVKPVFIQLLDDDDRLSGFIEDPLPYTLKWAHFSIFWSMVKQLRAEQFDCFIGAWEHPKYAWLGKLAGIPMRIGHRMSFWNWILYSHTVTLDYLDFFIHKVEYNLALLKPLGIEGEWPVQLVSKTESSREKEYLVLHIDAGNPIRILFKEQFLAIIKGLLDQTDLDIVCLGRTRNRETMDYLKTQLNNSPRVIDAVERYNLKEIKDLIAHATLLIGSDSGPVHIASGFQKSIVVYYLNRIQNACHWGPWMTPHTIVSSAHDCIDVCAPEICQKTLCRETLNPQHIVEAALDQLKEPNRAFPFHHWLKTSSTLGLFGSFSDDMKQYLKDEGWTVVDVDPKRPLSELKRCVAEHNINLFLFPQPLSLFESCRMWVLSRWASNYMAFLPKRIIASTAFDFEYAVRKRD